MTTTALSLDEIYSLAKQTLLHNGCDEMNAEAVSKTVTHAERDGSVSHGLFRIPGYTAALTKQKSQRRCASNQSFTNAKCHSR